MMGVAEWTMVGVTIITLIFGVISKLLSAKDAKQEDDINTLFKLLRQVEEKQRIQELDLAKNYHNKGEIQQLLEGMKVYLNERFDHLEQRFARHDKGQ